MSATGLAWLGALLTVRGTAAWLAVRLDAAFGEPPARMHPVCRLGALVSRLEPPLRSRLGSERLAGALLAFVVVLAAVVPAAVVSLGPLVLARAVHPGFLVAVLAADALLGYLALSASMLAEEGLAVADALASSLAEGRTRVAMLVGRDTDSLDEAGVARATVETLAENTVDAVVAPLFWTLVLGGTGAWLHKSASTLDSMIGYRDERYARFGTVGARLDDLLAWLPARLAVPTIALAAARMPGLDAAAVTHVARRDRLKHASPNSAHGEAAFAGALGVRLGGESRYRGAPSVRPFIGAEYDAPACADITRAAALVAGTARAFGRAALALAVLGAVVAVIAS